MENEMWYEWTWGAEYSVVSKVKLDSWIKYFKYQFTVSEVRVQWFLTALKCSPLVCQKQMLYTHTRHVIHK